MLEISLRPRNDRANGWSRMLPLRKSKPKLEGGLDVDWVVVGAGFAGLAAARRLAENRPGDSVALLEADEVGENASGRNSGFAIDLPHNVGSALNELEGAQRYIRLSRAAIDHLERQVVENGIECDWSRRGKYHAAVSPRGTEEILAPFARELEVLGEPLRWLDRKGIARELGTSYYDAAVYTPGCALLNPAALTRGLADTLPSNVSLFEHTPVTGIEYGSLIEVRTLNGSLRSGRMILAVNGWAPEFGVFRGELLRFAAYASLTRPLSDDERKTLGGTADWGLTPANAFVSTTMRLTADGRILVRYHILYCPGLVMTEDDLMRARRDHLRILRQRFPMLPDVGLESTWGGFVCLSRNHAPGFGEVRPNVWSAVCQNAVGVTKGTISGLLAADKACGLENPLLADMESLGRPASLPPRPFLDWGVRLRNRFDLWWNRNEA